MKFYKMQGLGNDFIVINNIIEKVIITPEKARFLCDRHFGIGADQILILEKSEIADYVMLIINADGSEVEMCGNGARAIAIFAKEQGICEKNIQTMETKAGIKTAKILSDNQVQIEMGEARFSGTNDFPDNFIQQDLEIDGQKYQATCVSVGNPHCIIFVEDTEKAPVKELGSKIENHPLFPKRINAEFVQIISDQEIKMRVWERGAGETMACGTGATASAVAAIQNGFCKPNVPITVHLRGGDLEIIWDKEKNQLKMAGEAKIVFIGEI